MATRLYLCAAATTPVTPGFAAWTTSASALRRKMRTSTDATDALATATGVTSTAGQSALHRQFVSDPLNAGITFTSGTATFTCQIQGIESAANDNIINRVRAVKVVSEDGATLRATLIALGNAASVVEWNSALRNLTFLNATAAGASYTTVLGDRLVLEVGHNDTGGLSISGQLRFGADSAGTGDLGINETDLTTTLRPWFESSVNLTFAPTALVAGAPVVTVTAPTVIRTATKALVAGTTVLTVTAPAATRVAQKSLLAGATVTFSAPTVGRTAVVTRIATNPSVIFTGSAAVATGAPASNLAAGTVVINLSAPTVNRITVRTMILAAPQVAFSSPAATRVAARAMLVTAPTVTFSGSALIPGAAAPSYIMLLGAG